MHLEMTNKICALCKHLVVTNGYPDSTRLCEECRSLIQTILPKAGSSSFSVGDQARDFAQPQLATAGMAQPARGGVVSFEEDINDVEMISRPGHYEMASFDPVADFDEVHGDRFTHIETEYLDEFEAGGEQARMPAEALPDPVDEAAYQSDEDAGRGHEVFVVAELPDDFRDDAMAWASAPSENVPPDKLPEIGLPRDEEPAGLISSPGKAETDARADIELEDLKYVGAAKDAGTSGDAETGSYQEAVDPWDDPLPVWEQSRNEYPLYLGISDRARRSRRKTLLAPAVLLVLVFLVAAYLIFQSGDSAPKNQQAAVDSGQGQPDSSLPVATPGAADSTKPASDEARQAASTSSDAAAAGAEKRDAPVADATASDGAETQWRHSLQALASPSGDEARAFAERLTSAGIPAYVIPADIANRGRWFRVRIGGFNTAQEAQKFAAEARMRAKAAGVALKDLNVVDYAKP